jgi:hypothetical protein
MELGHRPLGGALPELALIWMAGVIATWIAGAASIVFQVSETRSKRWMLVKENLAQAGLRWDARSRLIVQELGADADRQNWELGLVSGIMGLVSWFGLFFFCIMWFGLRKGQGGRRSARIIASRLARETMSVDDINREIKSLGLGPTESQPRGSDV